MVSNRQVKASMAAYATKHGLGILPMADNGTWGDGAKGNAWRVSGHAREHGKAIKQSTARTVGLVRLLFPAPAYAIEHDYHAVNHGGSRSLASIKYVVIHDGEVYLESAGAHPVDRTAEAMGAYFQSGSVIASPHFGADNDTIQQYLALGTIGWHCTSFNTATVGIEQGGFASWSEKQWKTETAVQLDRLSWLLAHLHGKTGVPLVFRDAAYLRAHGKAPHVGGVTTHLEATRAWTPGDHTDPGPGFPMEFVLSVARRYAP